MENNQFPAKKKGSVVGHLKVLAFLTMWLTIPTVLLWVLIFPKAQTPQIYQAEFTEEPLASPASEETVYFRVKLKGVAGKDVANLPLFVKGVNQENQLSFTFDPVLVWQDETEPDLFLGKLSLSPSLQEGTYTFWIKGPVHLQRRFDGVVLNKGEELDFTQKPLLPGDLALPDTGQDDRVDFLDRDYLWSLIAKDGRKPSKEEITAADLDLDAKITGRDFSLLIDTGVGSVGEE